MVRQASVKKIQRQALVNALGLLRPGLSNNAIIETGVCFNFHGDRIVTFGGNISVQIPFETGIQGAVRAEDLYKLLDKISADEIELTQAESEIKVRAGKVRAGLNTIPGAWPWLQPENDFLDLPEQFKEALRLCLFSCSKDQTRPHLTCIHFQGTKATSSDNWRITQFTLSGLIPYDFLLPMEAAVHLIKYQVTHMALDKAWIHFADDKSGLIFSVLRKMAKFINTDKFFDIQGQSIKLPDLTKTLERTKIMVEGDSELDLKVKLTLQDNKLVCRGQKEIGWIEEEVPIQYSGHPIVMVANPLFLVDILTKCQEILIGENCCLFQGNNFRHLLLLVNE